MKQWKRYGNTDNTILEQFLHDYKLTIDEGAKALNSNSRALKEIIKNANKADVDFIERFCDLSGYKENELFDNKIDLFSNNDSSLFEIHELYNNLNEFQKSFLDNKEKLNIYMTQEVGIFGNLHKPIISLIGDIYANKNSCFDNYIPQLSVFKNSKLPVYIFSYEDCRSSEELGDYFVITPGNENYFEPSMAFDPQYIQSCDIEKYKDDKIYPRNSVIVIKSNCLLLKNCILLVLPDFTYETDAEQVATESLRLFVSYVPFSDIIIFFDAISRLLALSETPLIQYFLSNMACKKSLLFVATKRGLNIELQSDTGYIEKQKKIQEKKSNNSYDKAYSFKPLDKSQIELIQSLIFFYNSDKSTDFIYKLNEMCISFNKTIEDNIKIYKKLEDVINLPPISKDLIREINGKMDQELKLSFKNASEVNYIKSILDTEGVNLGKQGLESFLIFIQLYSSEVLKGITKIHPFLSPDYVTKYILPECNLYMGNLILPMIRENTSFSKGTSETWAKKISKKIQNSLGSDYYKDFSFAIKYKSTFMIRNCL